MTELEDNIIVINKIAEARKIFDVLSQDTLVIFDVDCVLTMPSDPILQLPTFNKYRNSYKKLLNHLNRDERHIFNHLLILKSSSKLVEDLFVEIIKNLQQRTIKTMAMTAGKMGFIKDLYFPNWRYNELKRLGIDFSSIFPNKINFSQS